MGSCYRTQIPFTCNAKHAGLFNTLHMCDAGYFPEKQPVSFALRNARPGCMFSTANFRLSRLSLSLLKALEFH